MTARYLVTTSAHGADGLRPIAERVSLVGAKVVEQMTIIGTLVITATERHVARIRQVPGVLEVARESESHICSKPS